MQLRVQWRFINWYQIQAVQKFTFFIRAMMCMPQESCIYDIYLNTVRWKKYTEIDIV